MLLDLCKDSRCLTPINIHTACSILVFTLPGLYKYSHRFFPVSDGPVAFCLHLHPLFSELVIITGAVDVFTALAHVRLCLYLTCYVTYSS